MYWIERFSCVEPAFAPQVNFSTSWYVVFLHVPGMYKVFYLVDTLHCIFSCTRFPSFYVNSWYFHRISFVVIVEKGNFFAKIVKPEPQFFDTIIVLVYFVCI